MWDIIREIDVYMKNWKNLAEHVANNFSHFRNKKTSWLSVKSLYVITSRKIMNKTSNRLNNILYNKIENFNICYSKGIYQLTCVNCEKFYIGRTNRNFKTRFKEHKKYFIYGEGRSNFSTHVIEEGHEMNKNIEDTMTILNKESNHEKINKLEDIKIIKAAASQNILNDIINGRKDLL